MISQLILSFKTHAVLYSMYFSLDFCVLRLRTFLKRDERCQQNLRSKEILKLYINSKNAIIKWFFIINLKLDKILRNGGINIVYY